MENEKCSYCGQDKVLNPKTGKMFCKDKCWLKKEPQQGQPQPQSPTNMVADDVSLLRKEMNERFNKLWVYLKSKLGE